MTSTSPCCRERLAPIAALLLAVATLAGCAGGGAPQRAAETPSAAASIVPENVAKRYADAQTLLSVEDFTGAVAVLEPLVSAHPDLPGAAVTLAIAYRHEGRTDEAQALLQTTLVAHDNYAPGWNEVGILHREAGEFAAAEAAYLKAVTAKPDYALAHFNLGILLDLYLGRHEQALEHYQRYQELMPDEDKQVARWIADISRRLQRSTRAAQLAQ